MKDPEKYGATESISEDIDDIMVQAGNDITTLKLLLQFFKEMFEISKPFTDKNTKRIKAPNGKIPINKLSPGLKQKIDSIDGAFVETMSYTEWIQVFIDGYKKIKQKLEQSSVIERITDVIIYLLLLLFMVKSRQLNVRN